MGDCCMCQNGFLPVLRLLLWNCIKGLTSSKIALASLSSWAL
jgi:hypothetical protein